MLSIERNPATGPLIHILLIHFIQRRLPQILQIFFKDSLSIMILIQYSHVLQIVRVNIIFEIELSSFITILRNLSSPKKILASQLVYNFFPPFFLSTSHFSSLFHYFFCVLSPPQQCQLPDDDDIEFVFQITNTFLSSAFCLFVNSFCWCFCVFSSIFISSSQSKFAPFVVGFGFFLILFPHSYLFQFFCLLSFACLLNIICKTFLGSSCFI